MLKGKDIVIYENGKAIAASHSCDITAGCEVKEVSSPVSGSWRNYTSGRRVWNITVNYFVTNVKGAIVHIGDSVTLTMGVCDDEELGSDRLMGQAICIESRMTGINGNLAQGTWIFQGCGCFERVAVGLFDSGGSMLQDSRSFALRALAEPSGAQVSYDLDYEGEVIQSILDCGKELRDRGYIFLGFAGRTLASAPTKHKSFYIAAPGTYAGYGDTYTVENCCIGIFAWDGTLWTKEQKSIIGDGDLFFAGNVEIGKDLNVKGRAELNDTNVDGDVSITGDVLIGGDLGSEERPILRAFIDLLKSSDYSGDGQFDSGIFLGKKKEGHSYLVVDELFVRMKAIFSELEIRKLSYAGGNIIFSHAGSHIVNVAPIYKSYNDITVGNTELGLSDIASVDGTTLTVEGDSSYREGVLTIANRKPELSAYRCYIRKDDGTTSTENWWRMDDQARCQTFNIEEGVHQNVENTYYWRRVVGVGSEKPEGSDETYDYVDLSVDDCDGGSDVPKEGDSIVQMGNRTDTARQGFIAIDVYSEDGSAPSFKVYKGVNSYTLEGKQRIVISPKNTELVVNKFSIETSYDTQRVPMFRGDWVDVKDKRCYYYDVVMHNGATWLCVYPESSTSGTTTEPSEDSPFWKIYAEKGKSIRKVAEVRRYAISSQGEEAPGASSEAWGYAKPVAQKGEWLWTETAITWSDASRTVLYNAERNPNDGINGMSVGINEQAVLYALSDSGTVRPAESRFGQYPSEIPKGSWLWVLTVVAFTYSDGKDAGTSKSYSVSYISEDGKEGRSITSVVEYFLATDKKTGVTNKTAGFTTAVQETSKDKPYLWNYERITYSDGAEDKDARLIGMYSEDGRGIDSIVNYYLASKNKTGVTESTTGWTTTVQPINSALTYLWNYEVITYTDGGTSKTQPHIIGHYGSSAAVAFCSPQMLVIPTDTEGISLADYDKELQFGLSVDGVNLVIKNVEFEEVGWNSYISRKGVLHSSSSSASVSGSTITMKAQNVSGSTLQLSSQAGYSVDMDTASISVKVAAGTSVEDRSIKLKITGTDTDGSEYSGDCTIQVMKQYVVKDGEDGKDGKDGVSIALSTTSIIWEQDIDDESIIKPSAHVVEVIANEGGQPITSGITIDVVDGYHYNYNEVVAEGNSIVIPTEGIHTYKEGGLNKFYTSGYIDVNVIYNGRTTAFQINWYLNALGTFKTTIKGDVEESVAKKLTYGIGDGNLQTIEEVGRYIRSSSEAVTSLSKEVDGVTVSVEELKVTANGLESKVQDNEDNYAQITQRVDNIALKVGKSPNLLYNAFFDRNLTEVYGATLPAGSVGIVADSTASYGQRALSFGYGYFVGNHRTGFMGADTKGYGVFLREGTYTFKARARVSNTYTQGDAGIILACDDKPDMRGFSSSKIIKTISVTSTEYNVLSHSFTLTTGRYVAFYLYFSDASVGSEGLQILLDAVSLVSGSGVTGFDAGNDTNSAGEAVETMGDMLYDTGIDIEHKKITFTSDNFVYRNNKGEITALIDDSGNMTIAGVYNNEVNEVNEGNANRYGYYGNGLLYIDPLKCPAVVKINIGNLSKIILPIAYNGNTSSNPVTYIEGSKAGASEEHHTLEEIRQCIGKKIWLLRGDMLQGVNFAIQSGGHATSEGPDLLMEISDGLGDLADVTGATTLVYEAGLGHKTSGSDNAYRNFILECKMGVYNNYECIYWELRRSGIRLT